MPRLRCGAITYFIHGFCSMRNKGIDKIPLGPKLDALTAEKVFGWRKVHKREGSLVGRKQDKAVRSLAKS